VLAAAVKVAVGKVVGVLATAVAVAVRVGTVAEGGMAVAVDRPPVMGKPATVGSGRNLTVGTAVETGGCGTGELVEVGGAVLLGRGVGDGATTASMALGEVVGDGATNGELMAAVSDLKRLRAKKGVPNAAVSRTNSTAQKRKSKRRGTPHLVVYQPDLIS
jgi:hypothetical protein